MTRVREVMSPTVVTARTSTPIRTAARLMRDADIGDLLVTDLGEIVGIVTDRDIVVRGLACHGDLDTPIGEIATDTIATVRPSDSIEHAEEIMRRYAVRRLPVLHHNRPVGMVSLSDVARSEEPTGALASIAAWPPNN
jgi:CBS domain-containing protein